MQNENEIREAIHLAQLEIIGLVEFLNDAHMNLLMRHFDKCRTNISALILRANQLLPMIPEETGE